MFFINFKTNIFSNQKIILINKCSSVYNVYNDTTKDNIMYNFIVQHTNNAIHL